MKFSANVSILFKEHAFLERFAQAAEAGFSGVEFWWPTGEDLGAVERAVKESGLEVALFNFDAGDMPAGDRGILADPLRERQFRENVPVALDLARSLGCRKLNALIGCQVPGISKQEQLELARNNIRFAADQAKKHDIEVLVEAVNTYENGPYLLFTTKQAVEFIESVGRDNVKLQYDCYHMQRMEGNLVATIREHMNIIAHVQIADSPGRGEPGTGEINYSYVLHSLDDFGYAGYVGLEYQPTTHTKDSFRWIGQMESYTPEN